VGIKFGIVNLLELGTVTVTSEASGYPKHRLFDRFLGRMWKATGTAEQVIKVDQGAAGNQAVDALVVPAGHNLDGCTCYWEYSTDDFAADINVAAQWTQSGSGLILKTLGSALTKRYWRLRITGASVAPEVGECFMTELKEISSAGPEELVTTRVFNVARSESLGGVGGYLVRGAARRMWEFSLKNMESAEYDVLDALLQGWAGANPFVFVDPDGAAHFVEIVGEVQISHRPGVFKTVRLRLQEAL